MVVIATAYVLATAAPLSSDPLLTAALAVAVVGAAALDQALARGPSRRAARAATSASVATATALLMGPVAHHQGWASSTGLDVAYAGLVLTAVGFLVVDLLTARWQAAAAAGLVIELGETSGAGVGERIGRAVGDPTLEIGYWQPDARAYVTEDGRRLQGPAAGAPGRRVTLVSDGAAPLAAIEHDRQSLADHRLLDDMVAATRFAVTNAALDDQVRHQVQAVRSSRQRLVGAGDDERRRIEARLRQGPLRHLDRARSCAAAAGLTDDAAAITEAAERLTEVAAGIYPPGLADGDLGPALRGLARRASLTVAVHAVDRRLPTDVATAVYFVCAEAVTNTAKYARATRVSIEVDTDEHGVAVRVADDGRGGADQGRGSGLRGLADRCEALGGTFAVVSRPGAGTTVTATLPLDGGARR